MTTPLALAALLALAAPEAAVQNRGPLRVYTSGSYMPLHGQRGTERIGIEAELAALVARELVKPLEFVDRASTGTDALTAVATGKADLALSAVTPTPERAARVDFTRPYHALDLRLAGPPLEGLAALAGRRIGVPDGVTVALARSAKVPGTLVVLPSVQKAVAAARRIGFASAARAGRSPSRRPLRSASRPPPTGDWGTRG